MISMETNIATNGEQAMSRRSGKSLVELLVSIGIIALMASIFLSAAMMVLRMAQNLGR